MKGHKEVIDALNRILTNELTAVNQYFLHGRMCRNWGYSKLAAKIYEEALDEMKHAKELIDRLLFLEGAPNMRKLNPLSIGQTAKEQLQNDLRLEQQAIPDIKTAIAISEKQGDHGTRDILAGILASEEEHLDWLESQLHLIKTLGEENYLSQQIHKG